MRTTRVHPASTTAAALLALVLLGASSCGSTTAPSDEPPPTVTQPTDDGPPGELLEVHPVDSDGTAWWAWELTYRSTAVSGTDISVTGLLVVPVGDPPVGGWPLVSYAHPTTGTGDRCAPSLSGPRGIPLLGDHLDAGFAVVVSDYEGLGSDIGHPYLVGISEAHAVLDAARSAYQVDGSGLVAGGPVALLGYSQGGHAALWAANQASDYAPDLDLVGVAVAAPVSDVARFVERAAGRSDQYGVVALVVHGYAQAYPELSPSDVLAAPALELAPVLESGCVLEVTEAYAALTTRAELLTADPVTTAPWDALLAENAAGLAPSGLPTLVVQGADDDIVLPEVTDELVDRLCAQGDIVEHTVLAATGHNALRAAATVPWLVARFAGEIPHDDCPAAP